MRNFYLGACIVAASAIIASTAGADIFSDCAEAIERGDDTAVQDMALTIQEMGYISPRRQAAADICVSAGIGDIPLAEAEDMQAERAALREAEAALREAERVAAEKEAEARRIEARQQAEKEAEAVRQRICQLQEVVIETSETIRQAEAAQQDRRIETLAATVQECATWFDEDARAALTNDVCNSIFASGGLPNSEIAGPTTSEVLLAEVIHTNASTELEILIESGMLLETIAAMAAEMGISENGDTYNCSK